MNKIKKRTGKLVEYNPSKIKNAIIGANSDIENKASNAEIEAVYDRARIKVEKILEERDISVEEINDIVEKSMIRYGCYELVKQFIEYRFCHKLIRESNTTDKSIFELINGESEYWNDENSNKNAKLLTTQRDYIAGITSTDIARRFVFPKKSIEAHDAGIIHIHDMDYAAEKQRINCCLVNLNDMLQNGTVLNGIKIEKPHRFITACTIATQIIVAVSASNYGGTTVTLTHLAPFVRYSFYKHYKFYIENMMQHELSKYITPETPMDDVAYKFEQSAYFYAKEQLKKEIEDGVQTFNYQVNSMSSTNGQAPFLSVCMYLGETDEYKAELAMVIEEFLKQRIQGMKNPQGVYITVAFPKLLYVLEEDNIKEGSKYYYLTKLAAKCSAKRLVPDYISEKKMHELKGDAYPCMGCVAGNEIVTYKLHNGQTYTESFECMWNRLSNYYKIELQPNKKDFMMRTILGVKIYDQREGFVDNYGIIKNHNSEWLRLTFSNGRKLSCTLDHPFETTDGRIVLAKDLNENDLIEAVKNESVNTFEVCHLVKVEPFHKEGFSYDVTTESEHFTVSGIFSHNCRSFLTPDRFTENGTENVAHALDYDKNKHKYYGRFNLGVASVNIPAVAVLSGGDLNTFWTLLDKYCELCHDALKVRIKRLEGCTSDIAPILYQYGAFARLEKGESLKPLIYNGYATISLGYAGLYETVKFFTGKSNTTQEGKDFQIKIMQFLNDKCNEWKKAENIDYSLYGTPIENTVGKFAKAVHKLDKDFFVKIDGRDRDFVTNSYHVFVEEQIDAFDKLALEGEYQALSPGGCISYVESADLTQNTEAVIELLKFMYDHTMYAEINTKSDYCQVCGYDKEIEIIDYNHKLKYRCPNCGNMDDKKMNVARRVCGYISTNIPNQARLEEIANRYVHVDNHSDDE